MEGREIKEGEKRRRRRWKGRRKEEMKERQGNKRESRVVNFICLLSELAQIKYEIENVIK